MTENVKTEENFKTKLDFRGEENVQKTIKTVYFTKQENNIKQDHHEYIDKNVIQSLNKMNMSYNPDDLN